MEISQLLQIEMPRLRTQKKKKSEKLRKFLILAIGLSASASAGLIGPGIYRIKAKLSKPAVSVASSASLNDSGGEFGSYGADGMRAAGTGSLGMVGAANAGKLAEDQNPFDRYQAVPDEDGNAELSRSTHTVVSGEDFLAKNLKALRKDMQDIQSMKSGVSVGGAAESSPDMSLPIEGMDQGSKKSSLSGFSIAGARGKGGSGKRALIGGQGSALGQLFAAKIAARTSYRAGAERAGSLDSLFESGGIKAARLSGLEEDHAAASRNLNVTIKRETGQITRCSKVSAQLQPAIQPSQESVRQKADFLKKECDVKWTDQAAVVIVGPATHGGVGGWDTCLSNPFNRGKCKRCEKYPKELAGNIQDAAVLNCKVWRACEKDTDNQLRAGLSHPSCPDVHHGREDDFYRLANKFNLGSACREVIQRCLE